jgi:hypothetical protein
MKLENLLVKKRIEAFVKRSSLKRNLYFVLHLRCNAQLGNFFYRPWNPYGVLQKNLVCPRRHIFPELISIQDWVGPSRITAIDVLDIY